MTTFDIILLTDTAAYPHWTRGYGAHRLASHLRSRGYSVLVIDFAMALTFDLWLQICQNSIGDNTRMVGFSTTWWPYRKPFQENNEANFVVNWADMSNDFLKREVTEASTFTHDVATGKVSRWIDVIKAINKNTKIVVGGSKIEWYRDFPADNFIDGFGETQIIDYLEQTRRIWPTVIGHDKTAQGSDWGWTTCSTTYTDYDFIHPNEVLTLEIARGCRFKCAFCSYPLIGNKDAASYTKTEETLYNELLANYEKWKVTDYWIADDTFNDSTEKLEMFLRVTNRLPFKLRFRAYIRLDVIAMQPQQIQMLYDMGLKSCWIGIETFHPVASKAIGKGMNEVKRKQALYDIQKVWGNDVAIAAGYIIGLPGEDEQFLREQLEWFMEDDNPVNHNPNFLPLIINPPGAFEFHQMSDIDRYPEKYGYTIPDMSKHNFWIKDDNTGINNLEKAMALTEEFLSKIKEKGNKIHDTVTYDRGINDPVTEYFIPLIEKLKG